MFYASYTCTLFGLMGVAIGDASLGDWSPPCPGDDEKPGDWCIPSCSGDAEAEEELSSSKTSDGNEAAEAKEMVKCELFCYNSGYKLNVMWKCETVK